MKIEKQEPFFPNPISVKTKNQILLLAKNFDNVNRIYELMKTHLTEKNRKMYFRDSTNSVIRKVIEIYFPEDMI
jgi:hypothetical protein